MRLLIISALLFSSTFMRICGSEAPPPGPMPTAGAPGVPGPVPAPVAMPTAPVAAPPTTAAVPPAVAAPATGAPAIAAVVPISATRYGGTVVPVGNQTVEVIPMSDGQVVAYLNDPSGNPVTTPGDVQLAVKLGSSQPLTLAWQETDLRFSASVTNVQLTPGPVEVTLTQAGQTQTGSIAMVPVVPPPAHGGVVLAVGTYSSEIITNANGSIVAYLNGPEGAAVLDPQVQVVANVQAAGGAAAPVSLTFDPAQQCWVGQVGAGVAIAPGPVQVAVTTAGATAEGRFEAVAPLPQPEHGGTVVAAGGFGVEVVPAANGEVEAFLKDSAGAAAPPDGMEVTVNFQSGPRPEPVVLVWNAGRGRFVGRVRAGVRIQSAPAEVVLIHRGRRLRGRHASLFGPVVRVGVGAIPPPPVVRIGAPPPPVVGVVVNPPPPPVVRVRPPAPPAVRVDVRPPAPPAVRVEVRPPAPPAVRVEVRPPAPPAVRVEIGGPSKRGGNKRGGGGIDIRAGGGIRIGN